MAVEEKNIEMENIYENIEYDGFHTFYQVYVVLSLFTRFTLCYLFLPGLRCVISFYYYIFMV